MTQDHKTQNSKPGPEGIIGFMKGFLATQPHNFCFGCIAPLGCTDAPRSDAAAICCKNCGSGAGGAAYPVQSVRSLQRIACWLCAKKTRSKILAKPIPNTTKLHGELHGVKGVKNSNWCGQRKLLDEQRTPQLNMLQTCLGTGGR